MNPRKRNRTRGRGPLAGLAREPFAAGIALATNPNRAKRNAAPLNYGSRSGSSLDAIVRLEAVDPRNLPGSMFASPRSVKRGMRPETNPSMATRPYGPAIIERS